MTDLRRRERLRWTECDGGTRAEKWKKRGCERIKRKALRVLRDTEMRKMEQRIKAMGKTNPLMQIPCTFI